MEHVGICIRVRIQIGLHQYSRLIRKRAVDESVQGLLSIYDLVPGTIADFRPVQIVPGIGCAQDPIHKYTVNYIL